MNDTRRHLPPPPRRRGVIIQLPPVDSDEALLLIDILQRALRAGWRAYGEALAAEQDDLGVVDPPIPTSLTAPHHPDDEDIP